MEGALSVGALLGAREALLGDFGGGKANGRYRASGDNKEPGSLSMPPSDKGSPPPRAPDIEPGRSERTLDLGDLGERGALSKLPPSVGGFSPIVGFSGSGALEGDIGG